MAYTGKTSTTKNSDSVPFEQLKPKDNNSKDPQMQDILLDDSRKKTLRTLNALKIVSPIISALMERPGIDASGEDLTDTFKHLITETSTLSNRICNKMDINPELEKNFWVRNVFERLLAELFKEQWVKYGKTSSIFIENFVDKILEKDELIFNTPVFEDLDATTTVKVTLMKSSLKVLGQVKSSFDLFRKIDDDIEGITIQIRDKSLKAVEQMASENSSLKDRLNLFNLIIQEATDLYCVAWKTEAKRVVDICSSYSDDKLAKYLDKYPNGLPLDKINHDFDKYFEKLLVITEKLVPNKKGTIDKRLATDNKDSAESIISDKENKDVKIK